MMNTDCESRMVATQWGFSDAMGKLRSFSVLIVLACAAFSAQSTELDEAYKQGLSSWQDGDIVSAMDPLRKAADGGHAAAQALYANLLDEAGDDSEAASYYKKSADQNNPDGLYGLATLHIHGDGVEKNPRMALALLERAGALEHAPSIAALAIGYSLDTFELGSASKDSPDAWKWLKKASGNDHLESMAILEAAYRAGTTVIPKDVAAADALRIRSAQLQGIDLTAKKKRQRR